MKREEDNVAELKEERNKKEKKREGETEGE